jgi:hypothetical protein
MESNVRRIDRNGESRLAADRAEQKPLTVWEKT